MTGTFTENVNYLSNLINKYNKKIGIESDEYTTTGINIKVGLKLRYYDPITGVDKEYGFLSSTLFAIADLNTATAEITADMAINLPQYTISANTGYSNFADPNYTYKVDLEIGETDIVNYTYLVDATFTMYDNLGGVMFDVLSTSLAKVDLISLAKKMVDMIEASAFLNNAIPKAIENEANINIVATDIYVNLAELLTVNESASSVSDDKTAVLALKKEILVLRDQLLLAFDNFDDRFLGSFDADPLVDNDGDALQSGALYFFDDGVPENESVMKVYDGSAWRVAYASMSGVLMADNNLSDVDATQAKANLGLNNVNNTSDMSKPVSTLMLQALGLKADSSDLTAHKNNIANPHSVTKAQVGLGNADNTSDMSKPVSTLMLQALGLKADSSDIVANNLLPLSSMLTVNGMISGELSLSITRTHYEATTTTTQPYAVTNIVQVDDTGDFYTCIQTSTVGILLTNTSYFTLSHAELTISNGIICYTKDRDAITGVIAVTTEVLDGVIPTPGAGGWGGGYIKKFEGGDYGGFNLDKPVIGSKPAGGDFLFEGIWYDSNGNPYIPTIAYLGDKSGLYYLNVDVNGNPISLSTEGKLPSLIIDKDTMFLNTANLGKNQYIVDFGTVYNGNTYERDFPIPNTWGKDWIVRAEVQINGIWSESGFIYASGGQGTVARSNPANIVVQTGSYYVCGTSPTDVGHGFGVAVGNKSSAPCRVIATYIGEADEY
ncbi:MAG: hypothetical protein KAQ94_06050 [Arcobacteraceae bacterium]|nr:hypothetical protein [Arcobacteraceae bacterium]